MRRRCSRTRIESEAIGALLDRGSLNHRFQQGLDPYSGTLNHPAPHVPAQPRGIGLRYGARLTPLERDATRWCKHDSRHVASVLMLRRMGWRRHGRSLTSIRLELSLCPACLRLSAFGCVDHRLGQPSGYGEGVDGVFEGLWVSGAGQAVGVGFA